MLEDFHFAVVLKKVFGIVSLVTSGCLVLPQCCGTSAGPGCCNPIPAKGRQALWRVANV